MTVDTPTLLSPSLSRRSFEFSRLVRTGGKIAVVTALAVAVGTFFVLMLTDFRGLQELGFISGVSILLAWVSMMTVFPAVLVIVDRRHSATAGAAIPRALRLASMRVPLVDQIPRAAPGAAALLCASTPAWAGWCLRSGAGCLYCRVNSPSRCCPGRAGADR
jgi:hypothetical protein